jgi:putative transposase
MSILHLTPSQRRQLRVRLRGTQDASYYRRLLALLELDRGCTVAAVADRLGVTRQSVYHWVACYQRCPRPGALRDHYGVGRPSLWTDALQTLLRAALRQRPDQLGYVGVNWTVPLLREHLHKCGGLSLSEDTIRRELDRLGYVWKRYRYMLPPDPRREKKTGHPRAVGGPAAAERDPGGG